MLLDCLDSRHGGASVMVTSEVSASPNVHILGFDSPAGAFVCIWSIMYKVPMLILVSMYGFLLENVVQACGVTALRWIVTAGRICTARVRCCCLPLCFVLRW
jgi:hypothetical protein